MSLIELHLENYALLRQASLEFGEGLNVLTGESGSGKSLSMEALRWCLGGRAGTAISADGASGRTRVAATFRDIPERAARLADDFGIPENDGLITIARQGGTGKASIRINGAVASARTLSAIAGDLVEIATQGESGRLSDSFYQRELLDWFCGAAGLRREMAELYLQKTALERTIARITEDQTKAVEVRAAAVAVQRQLAGLELSEERQEQLRAELAELSAATRIRLAAGQVRQAIGGADEQPGARDLVSALLPVLHQLPMGEQVASLTAAIDSLLVQLDGVLLEARLLAEGSAGNPERLAEVEDELSRMAAAVRRFGSLEAARQEQEEAERLLADAGSAADLTSLTMQLHEVTGKCLAHALRLHSVRLAASCDLEQQVTALLCELGIPEASFLVTCTLKEGASGIPSDGRSILVNPDGADQVQFLFSSAREMAPLPLSAVASGGELSRVALALRVLISGETESATLVLDEVDTGIGGETAIRMGEVLASLGKSRQIITITHRAEIAARADTHLLVRRVVSAAGTDGTIESITGQERVLEVARLLSGSLTAAARKRAVELLESSVDGDIRPRPAASRVG